MANKIRVAFPTNDRETISGHFGHCKEFALFDVEESKVINTEYLPSPAHQPGLLPKFLAENGTNIIVASGMGQKAVSIFESNKIEVIMGANGSIKDALNKCIEGQLDSTGSACTHDHDDHNCDH